ncbi:uncharacterized protein LOC135392066 isoform X2 [Ornithodoros turicata]|uniref:uncharacterized protein LOC135392066 isoform X2 n=1 Tax=Ornithodoros turicata TaxID=34597 RepID=UPI003138DA0D
MVFTSGTHTIPASKWRSVFDLLLFRELRDDVDDTLVQKLISCLDSMVIENREHAEGIWKDAGLREQIPRAFGAGGRAASTVFALRATGAFGQDENFFRDMQAGTQILHRLLHLEIAGPTRDSSVKAAYLRTLFNILSHRTGNTWVMEQGLFSKTFPCLQDCSIFVQNAAEKFLARFLSLNILVDPGAAEVSTVVDSVCYHKDINQSKRCLRIIKGVLDDSPEVADVLCSQFQLDVKLEELLKESETDSANDICLSELLCRLRCAREEWDMQIDTMKLLENGGKTATLIRTAATVLQYPQTLSPEINEKCFKTLGTVVLRHAKPSFVSSALCALRESIALKCDKDIGEHLLECLSAFLSLAVDESSYWAKQSRILAVACECFGLTLTIVEGAGLELPVSERYLGMTLRLLPNTNLSCHGIKELLSASVALALGIFSRCQQDFCWSSSPGLVQLATVFQRCLVYTDHEVIETALEVFPQLAATQEFLPASRHCTFTKWLEDNFLLRFVWDTTRSMHGNVRASAAVVLGQVCPCEYVWRHFRDTLQLTEQNANNPDSRNFQSDAIHLMTTMVVTDPNVFARRSAMAALSSWVVRDTFGAYSRNATSLRRTLLESVAFDLDSSVQRMGLHTWGTCLELDLNNVDPRSRNPHTASEVLKRADADGLGVALGRSLAPDSDHEVRIEAFGLVERLRKRLRLEFQMDIGPTIDTSFFRHMSGLLEPEEHVASSAEERSKGADEVLDKTISDWLQQKLIARGDTLPSSREDRLATLSGGATVMEILEMKLEVCKEDCQWKRIDSIIDDILNAAATEHRVQDCY